MTDETRLLPNVRPPQGSTSSDQSDEWADALEQPESQSDMDENSKRDQRDYEDVFTEKHAKVKGESELSQVASTIRTGTVDWSQLESVRCSNNSKSEAPSWVSEIHLRPSSIRSVGQTHKKTTSTSSDNCNTSSHSAIMPCIREQSNGNGVSLIIENDEEMGRNHMKSATILPNKKVTFTIPDISGSAVNTEDPEWVKLAEAKCNKSIKWEDLEKHDSTPNATTTWITQVHLKHVPVALETVDVRIPQSQNDAEQLPKIKVNLRHVVTSVQYESDKASNMDSDDESLNGSGSAHFKNGLAENVENHVKDEPDWLKVARQKKQVCVDWEQLEMMKKSGERALPVIKEDNQSVNDFNRHSRHANGFNKPVYDANNKSKNGLDSKLVMLESPYRTWVINKHHTSRTNANSRWQSDPQLNTHVHTLPSASTPTWVKLAEKKRNSVADWSTIERGPSPVSGVSANWLQEVRLKTPSPTPSSQSEADDGSKCSSPFPVQLRHVEEKLKPIALDLDEKNSPWISRSHSAEIDKWQLRYRDLFEDLSDETSPTDESVISIDEFFDNYRLPHSQSSATLYSHPRSNSSSPRRLRTLQCDANRQRRRLDSNHRYYSLPEMNVLPRNVNELEIVHLNGLESPLSVDDRPPTIPESPTSDDNEEKLVHFTRLRSTGRKETMSDSSPIHDMEPFWWKEIKLRKVVTKEVEMSSKLSHSSYELKVDDTRETSTHDYFKIPRTTSAPSHISSGLTIREAIHRDLLLEVARREQKKAQLSENHSSTAVNATRSPQQLSIQPHTNGGVTSTLNKRKTETVIILSPASTNEQSNGVSYPRPVWLQELKQRKTNLKHVEPAEKKSPKRFVQKSEMTSFENVLDEIKSKGKDQLFANLKSRPKKSNCDVDSTKSFSNDSESSTPLSVLSDDDQFSSQSSCNTAFTISETNDLDFAVVIHDDGNDDFLHRINSPPQDAKCKLFRPVRVPITVDHILQQHSQQQFIESSRLASIKNLNSPVRDDHKLKTVEEMDGQNDQELTITEHGDDNDTPNLSSSDLTDHEAISEKIKPIGSHGDLATPLLLLNFLSKFSKSCSETNLTALGAPLAKNRFEAATNRMTSSCSNLISPAAGKLNNFHRYDDPSWSSSPSVTQTRSVNEMAQTIASSSSASDLEICEEEPFENCKSQFTVQLQTNNSITTKLTRRDSEISLD